MSKTKIIEIRSTSLLSDIRKFESGTINKMIRSFGTLTKFMKNAGVTMDIGGQQFDEYPKQMGKQMLGYIKNNFLHNPPNWKPLSFRTRQVREYLDFPMGLYNDIADDLGYELETLRRLIAGIPVANHPSFSPKDPMMLNSGRLMNSAYMDYKKSVKKLGNVTAYIRTVAFNFRAPYAKVLINGGIVVNYIIQIRKGSSIVIEKPIPIQWQRKFKNGMSIGRGLTLYKIRTYNKVKGRDPYQLSGSQEQALKTGFRKFFKIVEASINKKINIKIDKELVKMG